MTALIGEQYLGRVTIVAQTRKDEWQRHTEDLFRSIARPALSPYTPSCPTPKLKVLRSEITWESMGDIISPYSSLGPQRFFAQDKLLSGDWQVENVTSYLQQLPENLSDDQPDLTKQIKMRPLPGGAVEVNYEGSSDLMDVQAANHNPATKEPPGSKQALGSCELAELEQREEEKLEHKSSESADKDRVPSNKPEQAEVDHASASPRAHPQVHDIDVEAGRVTQALDDINHIIEDLGQALSEYLVHKFCGTTPMIQDLEASRLQKLSEMFDHSAGKPSLVKSLTGEYPNLEDFFFSAVRSILCHRLYEWIFKPFHPSVAGPDHQEKNRFIHDIYKQIACQGEWQSN